MESDKTSRRKTERATVQLKVHLPNGVGITRDVGDSDMFVRAFGDYVVGQKLEFAVDLPLTGSAGVQLQCAGEIIRVEEGVGFAVRVDRSNPKPM
jgi:hypothetical protein